MMFLFFVVTNLFVFSFVRYISILWKGNLKEPSTNEWLGIFLVSLVIAMAYREFAEWSLGV